MTTPADTDEKAEAVAALAEAMSRVWPTSFRGYETESPQAQAMLRKYAAAQIAGLPEGWHLTRDRQEAAAQALSAQPDEGLTPESLADLMHLGCVYVEGEGALGHDWRKHLAMAEWALKQQARRDVLDRQFEGKQR